MRPVVMLLLTASVGCGWSPRPIEETPPECYELGVPDDPRAETVASAGTIAEVAVDGDGVYWTTTSEVFAASKETLVSILLAEGQEPFSLVVHRG